MKRDSFIVYRSFYEPVKGLCNEEKGVLFDVICSYALDGVMPEDLPPMVKMAFLFIASTIDRDSEKYQNIIQRNKENINKRWKKENTKNTTAKSGKISNSDDDNDNGSEKDNEFVNDPEKEKKSLTAEVEPMFKEIVDEWLDYKRAKGQKYKDKKSINKFLESLKELSGGNPEIAKMIINQSMANNWAGIFELKQKNKSQKLQERTGQILQPETDEKKAAILAKFNQ